MERLPQGAMRLRGRAHAPAAAPAPAAARPAAAAPAPAAAPKTAAEPGKKPVSAGRQAMVARERACGADWKAAKAAGKIPAGQKWPQYWSECDKRKKAEGMSAQMQRPDGRDHCARPPVRHRASTRRLFLASRAKNGLPVVARGRLPGFALQLRWVGLHFASRAKTGGR